MLLTNLDLLLIKNSISLGPGISRKQLISLFSMNMIVGSVFKRQSMFSFQSLAIIAPLIYACAQAISCIDVKEVGAGAKFTLEELQTLKEEDYASCLLFLGKDPIGYEEGKYIWENLVQLYQGVGGIPESELRQLGWISKSIPVKDIGNLTLGDIDTIAAFGQFHNLSQSQLEAFAQEIRDDWGSKEPSDYTFYDLMALQHLLCGFNRTVIEDIHPDSYKEAANFLATLQGCSMEALEALASLATSSEAFGDPSTWSSSQVKSVGCILNGLPGEVIASIPPQGIDSLTPDIVPCLLEKTLKDMTSSQLSHFTPSAAAALTPQQREVLRSEQQRAVNEAYEGNSKVISNSGGILLQPSRIFFSLIFSTLLVFAFM